MRQIILIIHNVRSCHNVGSLLRTAEGLGVNTVYLTGYTPYPTQSKDSRLPHMAAKINDKIAKTALGAEKIINWQHAPDIKTLITTIQNNGYKVYALEQTSTAQSLPSFESPEKLAIIVGNEVSGIEAAVLNFTDGHLVIPMFGQKESFNAVQAAAMALYHVRFYP